MRNGILGQEGVDIDQLGAEGLGPGRRVNLSRAVEAVLVDVGHHEQLGPVGPVQRVVHVAQAHGPGPGEQGHAAALLEAHVVHVRAEGLVVAAVVRADDGAHGLREGRLEERLAVERQQAVHVHDLVGHDAVGHVAPAPAEAVPGSVLGALVVECGLDAELLAGLELVLPLRAHLLDHTRPLVADDRRVLRAVVGHALVVRTRVRGLVTGHADAVGHHPAEDFVLAQLGQFKRLEPQIVGSVDADGCSGDAHGCFLSFLPSLSSWPMQRGSSLIRIHAAASKLNSARARGPLCYHARPRHTAATASLCRSPTRFAVVA